MDQMDQETQRIYIDVANTDQSIYLTPTADGLLLEIDGPSLTLSDAAVANLRKALQRYEYSRRPRPGENLTGYVS